MERHTKSVHEGIKSFKCNSCEYETLIKTHLKWHAEWHVESVHFKCHICQFTFTTKFSLKRHIASVHEKKNPLNFANATAMSKSAVEISEASVVTSNPVFVSNVKQTKS